MSLKEKLLNIKKQIINMNKSQNSNISISDDDKIKLLSELYTYNHGNKGCKPFEYSCNAGGKENDGGNYLLFEQEIQRLGYNIKEIVFVTKSYKLSSDAEAFENRKKTKEFYPSEVKYFVLTDKDENSFMLKETPETLEFLAKSGDKRAIITYNNWMKHIGAPNSMIAYEDSGISKEKTIKK